MRHIKSILVALTTSLALSPCARAQIGYLNAPSSIHYGATLNTSSFTVSSGASVLVVLMGTRNQGNSTNPGNPSNVKWNSKALTLAVGTNTMINTYDYNLIYYLTNPPAGSGTITATLGSGVSQTWWQAYTLKGVNITNAPIVAGVSSMGANVTVTNLTIANVPYGGYAAVCASASGGGAAPVTDPNGGTVFTVTDSADGNAAMTMGTLENIPYGSDMFVLTDSTAGKMVMCEAVFSPALTAFIPTFKMVGYEPSWDFNSSTIPYNHLTHVNYADINVGSDGSISYTGSQISSLVTAAHAAGVKVGACCTGVNGASSFSTLAASGTAINSFVNNMSNLLSTYNMDGVDIDWEFLNANADTNNFVTMMSALANSLHPQNKYLTAAVNAWGNTANVVKSDIFPFVDWLNIMDYDDVNGPGMSSLSSLTNAYDYWVGRGLPASKIMMGVPFYGDNSSWNQLGFADLLADGASPWSDSYNGYGYNGITTVETKVNICTSLGLGGMMIWDLALDATGADSLLTAMYSTLVPVGQTIALQANANNLWVNATASGASNLVANAASIGTSEEFVVVDQSNVPQWTGGPVYGYGAFALQAVVNGHYVTQPNAGGSPLIANVTQAQSWETFYWQPVGDLSMQLQAYISGLWITANYTGDQDLPLQGMAIDPKGWETYTIDWVN